MRKLLILVRYFALFWVLFMSLSGSKAVFHDWIGDSHFVLYLVLFLFGFVPVFTLFLGPDVDPWDDE